jgi:hypothetical protein
MRPATPLRPDPSTEARDSSRLTVHPPAPLGTSEIKQELHSHSSLPHTPTYPLTSAHPSDPARFSPKKHQKGLVGFGCLVGCPAKSPARNGLEKVKIPKKTSGVGRRMSNPLCNDARMQENCGMSKSKHWSTGQPKRACGGAEGRGVVPGQASLSQFELVRVSPS